MWVVKSHGVTFYVEHVSADIPWTTKETPDNETTKGSLKFKNCKLIINDDNTAEIKSLGLLDHNLPAPRLIHRVIFRSGSRFHQALKRDDYQHREFKYVEGGCGTSWVITDLVNSEELTMAALIYINEFRILSPNEEYFRRYDDKSIWIDEIEEDDGDWPD
jgi:hypothetical protein